MLSEKGKLASRLLVEFPEEDYQLQKRKRQKQFWTVAALSQIVYLISVLTLYYLKYVDFGQIVLYTIWFVGGIGLAYLGYRMQDRAPVHGSNEEKRRFRIAYIMLGGVIGLATAFFGTVFLTVISINLGGPNFTKIIDEPWEIISLITTLTVLGAFAGYYLGKRNNFNKSKWMAKIDEKLGF